MRAIGIVLLGLLLLGALPLAAKAHSLFMTINDNQDGTVSVEGLYSTGGVAAATPVKVKDSQGKVLWQGMTDELGECTVPKPEVPYTILLDAGPGHRDEQAGPPRK